MQEIKSGIYGIRNTINNKIYIGKSKNILKRWASHKSELKREIKKKDTNRYLWSSVKKYGLNNFEFTIIEELPIDEELFKIRELYWMDSFNSCSRDFGYNLRRDSKTKMIVHEETKALLRDSMKGSGNPNFGNTWSEDKKKYMSDLKKEGYVNGTLKINKEGAYKGIKERNRRWEENPQLKTNMRKKVSEHHNLYQYLKIDKVTKEILETFENRLELLEKYPEYKTSPLLSVCNGWKSSYKGFIWRYRDRKTDEIIEPMLKYKKQPII